MGPGILDLIDTAQRAAGIDAIGGLREAGAAVSANSSSVKESSTAGHERVVPVVRRWSQAFDRRVAGDHLATRLFASLVVVEAAVDVQAASH